MIFDIVWFILESSTVEMFIEMLSDNAIILGVAHDEASDRYLSFIYILSKQANLNKYLMYLYSKIKTICTKMRDFSTYRVNYS